MKIAVTARGKTIDDAVDARFGRCACFLVVDTDTMEAEAVENANASLGGGAGIQSAQLMAERGVQAVLTGNCGPNAWQTLNAAGIRVITGVSGRIRDVVEQYKSGALMETEGPNVASRFGTGAGSPGQDARGAGVGMGRGKGAGRAGPGAAAPSAGANDELAALKGEAQSLAEQLQALQARIAQLEGS